MITEAMRDRFINDEMTIKERRQYCKERLKEIIDMIDRRKKMCDERLDEIIRENMERMDGEDLSAEWGRGQFVCNQTKRERIFILLDNVLDNGDRLEYRFGMKTDEEIKKAVLRYADLLAEKAEELGFLATNMMIYGIENNTGFENESGV